jgi:hypothetical protein
MSLDELKKKAFVWNPETKTEYDKLDDFLPVKLASEVNDKICKYYIDDKEFTVCDKGMTISGVVNLVFHTPHTLIKGQTVNVVYYDEIASVSYKAIVQLINGNEITFKADGAIEIGNDHLRHNRQSIY